MPRLIELAGRERSLAALLDAQLDEVALIIERQLASDLPAVNALCRHVERYRGKMLRPTMVLVSGLAAGGRNDGGEALSSGHRTLAAVTELIHMATLVHDDVLDDALVRRRGETINALHGNEMAVMLGDYLISNAFHLCSTIGDPSINLALGAVTNTLCEGELLQLHHRDHLGVDEATYLEIIRRKTASLIGDACRLGAALAGADARAAGALRSAGEALGIAFQLQDDLLDLVGDEDTVGKSLGRDLAKGKLTLPIILHLGESDGRGRETALRMIEHRNAASLRTLLIEHGAVDRSAARARAYVEAAKDHIRILHDSPARDLMLTLADQVITRRF